MLPLVGWGRRVVVMLLLLPLHRCAQLLRCRGPLLPWWVQEQGSQACGRVRGGAVGGRLLVLPQVVLLHLMLQLLMLLLLLPVPLLVLRRRVVELAVREVGPVLLRCKQTQGGLLAAAPCPPLPADARSWAREAAAGCACVHACVCVREHIFRGEECGGITLVEAGLQQRCCSSAQVRAPAIQMIVACQASALPPKGLQLAAATHPCQFAIDLLLGRGSSQVCGKWLDLQTWVTARGGDAVLMTRGGQLEVCTGCKARVQSEVCGLHSKRTAGVGCCSGASDLGARFLPCFSSCMQPVPKATHIHEVQAADAVGGQHLLRQLVCKVALHHKCHLRTESQGSMALAVSGAERRLSRAPDCAHGLALAMHACMHACSCPRVDQRWTSGLMRARQGPTSHTTCPSRWMYAVMALRARYVYWCRSKSISR